MDQQCKSLCESLAKSIVEGNFAGTHALLAPWLRASMSAGDIQGLIEARNAELPHPPHSWRLDEGMASLADLRKTGGFGPPSKPLPNQITTANYRGWLNIQFTPDPDNEDDQDVCYDIWLVPVEHEGKLQVGYFEPWEAT